LIHGILHLCGYDHERSLHEARRMQARERALWRHIQPLPRLTSVQTDLASPQVRQSRPSSRGAGRRRW
jgi:hypothetical protein